MKLGAQESQGRRKENTVKKDGPAPNKRGETRVWREREYFSVR